MTRIKKKKAETIDTDVSNVIKDSYLAYSMATIARMLPNSIDGLKLTQRKILYVMYKNRILGKTGVIGDTKKNNEVLGFIAPYIETGDSSIYGALVRMGQEDRYHYPMIKSQGNFGYVADSLDNFAAQRYTESALSEFAIDMYFPEDSKGCLMDENFSGTLTFPRALATILPMSLVTGTTGACVGYKNDCPPHSLRGVGKAYIKFIKDMADLTPRNEKYIEKNVKLDFKNNSVIVKNSPKGLLTGKGRVTISGSYKVEDYTYGRKKIIITELPYLQSAVGFMEKLKTSSQFKELFVGANDYSGKEGMLIEMIVRKETDIKVAIEFLEFATPFMKTMNYSLIYSNDFIPKRMNVFQIFREHYDYKMYTITTYYTEKLDKLEKRNYNLKTLKYIIESKARRDKFFEILSNSDKKTIYINMMKQFGRKLPYLNDDIIDYVVDSKFNLFINKADNINKEIDKLEDEIERTKNILLDPSSFLISEIERICKKYK